MFKGMKNGLVCALLAMVLVAPFAHAGTWDEHSSPFISVTQLLSDMYQSLQEGLSNVWIVVFENDEVPAPVPADVGPEESFLDDPVVPETEDDDDGNFGPGQDPLG